MNLLYWYLFYLNENLYNFQDFYRKLLEAESEGNLDDVDMLEVEKWIFNHEAEMKSVELQHDVDVAELEEAIGDFELDEKWGRSEIY